MSKRSLASLVEYRRKYARIERERRFLLERFPPNVTVFRVRHITDRYIENSNLRLRKMADDEETIFKLTQKIHSPGDDFQQGFITTMYLTESEYELFSQLPAAVLCKTRHSVQDFGIDLFEDSLRGLVLAEAEFVSPQEASALEVPEFALSEVTFDERFTGGSLSRATAEQLRSWLTDYGMKI